MCTIFVQFQRMETTAPVSTMDSSGDEGRPSSSVEDVLVDNEKELPRSCGFTGKFKI